MWHYVKECSALIRKEENSMRLTEEMLVKGATNGIGWNREQFNILGVKYPPMRGWKDRIIGGDISPEKYQLFLSLKGKKKSYRHAIINVSKKKPMKEKHNYYHVKCNRNGHLEERCLYHNQHPSNIICSSCGSGVIVISKEIFDKLKKHPEPIVGEEYQQSDESKKNEQIANRLIEKWNREGWPVYQGDVS